MNEKEVQKLVDLMRENQKNIYESFPADVPNIKSNYALIHGAKIELSTEEIIELSNSQQVITTPRHSQKNQLEKVLETDYEVLYFFAEEGKQNSQIVSRVDECVKELPIWKTLAHIIQMSLDYSYMFEQMGTLSYIWIYNFEPLNNISEHHVIDEGSLLDYGNNQIISYKKFEQLLPLIELLLRDDKIFVALNQFISSIKKHHFCFFCEFQISGYKKHPSHEHYIDQQTMALPEMESAVVQCCRAVESIIGKPQKRKVDNHASLFKAKKHWESSCTINPEEIFFKTKSTFLDYYYELFQLRNDSAHSFGLLTYEVTRKLTIQAQCFAFIVLQSYIDEKLKSMEDAKKILKYQQPSFLILSVEDYHELIKSKK